MVRHVSIPHGDNYQRESWSDTRFQSPRYSNNLPVQAPRREPRDGETFSMIESALNSCDITEFAIAVARKDGTVDKYSSTSLRNIQSSLFAPGAEVQIQRAIGKPGMRTLAYPSNSYSSHDGFASFDTETGNDMGYGRRQSESGGSIKDLRAYSRSLKLETSDDDDAYGSRRKRVRGLPDQQFCRRFSEVSDDNATPVRVAQYKTLRLSDEDEVVAFYIQRFRDLQQSACKVIAKAFVKLLEPKKQTNFPYTGGHEKAPLWWPLPTASDAKDGVRHKEPDHLLKPQRVNLLVYIIGLIVDPNHPKKTDYIASIDIRKLEEVTNEAMTSWYAEKDHPDNRQKKPFLREIFKVAKQHERYKKGELDSSATIPVAHGDNVHSVASDDEIDDGTRHEDEDAIVHDMTPTSSLATPPDGIISPVSTHLLSNLRQEPNFYNNLSVRPPYQQQLPSPADDHASFPDQYRSTQHMYQAPTPVFHQQPDTQRRGSAFAIPVSNGFPSPAATSIFSVSSVPNPVWHSTPSMHHMSPPQYNSYTATPAPTQQVQACQLPPPQSMVQPPQTQPYHTGNVYEPLPHQHPTRTCALPGQGAGMAAHVGGYSDYLADSAYAPHETGMKHDLTHH